MEKSELVYKTNTASFEDVKTHLTSCDKNFTPPLSEKVDIAEYAKKIADRAVNFESWDAEKLAGLIACYFNDAAKKGFITNVSVLGEYGGKGIASALMTNCIERVKEQDFQAIELEVNKSNSGAIGLYKKFNFFEIETKDESIIMRLEIE